MIASIRGILEAKAPDRLVVGVGGVGLRVLVPGTVVEETGDIGDSVHLLTHLQVREDALTLYGFSSPDQLRLFELLISVTGVGPGHALSILSIGSADAVEAAIAAENVDYFSRAPRVGKKLAARIVLELKSKVRALEGAPEDGGVVLPDSDDVMGALLALGYTAGEAQAAIRGLPADPSLTTEQKVFMALSRFNRV